jgi:hypothetical protein
MILTTSTAIIEFLNVAVRQLDDTAADFPEAVQRLNYIAALVEEAIVVLADTRGSRA